MSVTVQDLIADKVKPVCISDDAMAVEALRLMMAHDYSQLPIVNDSDELVGMVTSDSVARALNLLALKIEDLKVSNALHQTKRYKLDSDISDLLDGLRDAYAVPVVDNFNRVIGIVTNYDTAEYFRGRAEDMMLVEDVETMLKDCIRIDLITQQGQKDDSELNAKISDDVGTKTFAEMTFSDYSILFIHGTRWGKFSQHLDLDRDSCRRMLKQVNDVRNDLFHFRTDISAERRYSVEYCRNWLDRHQQLIMDALRPVAGDDERPATIESIADEKGLSPEAVTSQIDALADSPQLIEKISSDTSKYEGIATFLQTLPQHVDNVEVSFEEFESIIEAELPRTAYEHRSWWANDSVGHVQSRQWLEVGWRVSSVNISQKRATFSRIKDREQKYIVFFSEVLTKVKEKGLELKDVSPSGRSFIQLNGIRSVANDRIAFVGCSFARKNKFRVEFYIDTGDHHRNQFILENLRHHQAEIDEIVDWKLEWETLDEKRAVRIAAYHVGSITDSEEALDKLSDWAAEFILRFDRAFVVSLVDRIVELDSRAMSA